MPSPELNSQIYTEASDWLIEFRAGDIDAAGRRSFHRWLQTSPEHMRAYLELAALWNEGAALDGCAPISDDQTTAFIKNGLGRTRQLRIRGCPKPSHQNPTRQLLHRFPF